MLAAGCLSAPRWATAFHLPRPRRCSRCARYAALRTLHEGDSILPTTPRAIPSARSEDHARRAEGVPHCIADGIFILQEEDAEPGLNMARILGFDDSIVEFESHAEPPRLPFPSSALPREASATFKAAPLSAARARTAAFGSIADSLSTSTLRTAILCPRYTARMVKNVKIAPSPRWMRERLPATPACAPSTTSSISRTM